MAEAMDNSLDVGEEAFRKLCHHYSRGCSLVSPCCGKVYPCRLCHNDQELSHEIDRRTVTEVECRQCHTQQPVTNTCSKCGLKFGNYFCETCRLYDDADKGQFHCDGCGLCRVGGRSNFFHCSKCCLCLPHSMLDNHTCRQSASKDNCPVCFEDIHSSTNSAHIPRCGHLIHMTCYTSLLQKGLYQCPQCQTSLPDMSHQWLLMDNERASWVMPQHLKDFKVKVKCRDCHEEGDAAYHIIGLKCPSCGSYNTVRSGNEEIPMDATVVNQLIQQRRRRRRRKSRQERNEVRGTSSSSSDSDSDEGDNHRNQHRSNSDSDDGEDPGNQSRPRPRQNNRSNRHGSGDDNGKNPTSRPPNEDDNSQSYDGDASENDDIDSNDESSSSDSDSDYYEARRSQMYVSFAQRGYSVFLSPIEVPAGSEPGALEWWQDPNDSELEPRNRHLAHDRPPESLEGREECDNGTPPGQHQRVHERSHQHHDQSEPHLVPDELNSPTEMRRRAIAQSIVQNMRLWNSDSDSFSELSSEEEEKSSDSWVTEEEEVIVGMRRSELQEQEEVEIQEEDVEDNCRDLPTTTFGDIVVHVQSESGVESAESWFTSSDNSHSQPCSQEQDKHPVSTQNHSGLYLNETSTVLEGQRKVERSSVCSSVSTDDSLAWETACEDLPMPPVCS